MNLNAKLLSTAVLAALSAGVAHAQEEEAPAGVFAAQNFTTTIALTTDYRFRGISNSDGPAISGSFDWGYQGFFVGAWASNTEFSDSNLEIDYYGGYAFNFNGLTIKGTLLYYTFPGEDPKVSEGFDPPGYDPTAFSPTGAGGLPLTTYGYGARSQTGEIADIDANYFEAGVSLSYTFANVAFTPSIGLSYNYSPDYFGEDGDAHASQLTLGAALPWGLTPYFNYGYQHVDGDEFSNFFFVPGYNWTWYNIGVSKTVMGFTLDFAYWDTFYDDGSDPIAGGTRGGKFERFYNSYNYETEGNRTYKDLTEGEFVFTIKRTF
jgi:hypothetical protein